MKTSGGPVFCDIQGQSKDRWGQVLGPDEEGSVEAQRKKRGGVAKQDTSGHEIQAVGTLYQ